MLYTTYLANIKNIPNDKNTICILITRWKPRNSINADKYNFDIEWVPSLGPSETLLARYKSDEKMKWSEFRKIYLEEAKNNKEFKTSLNNILKLLKENKDIFLVCYEKDDLICHRSILREIFHYNEIQCKEY